MDNNSSAILNVFMGFAGPFIKQMTEMAEHNKAKKKQLEEEYFRLNDLPRKKKKRRKKEILTEYAFYANADNNLFDDMDLDVLKSLSCESRSEKQFREIFSEPHLKNFSL